MLRVTNNGKENRRYDTLDLRNMLKTRDDTVRTVPYQLALIFFELSPLCNESSSACGYPVLEKEL